MTDYRALVACEHEGTITSRMEIRQTDAIDDGHLRIRVEYSSVNFKDALAFTPGGGVVRSYPIVPGIDVVGEIIESKAAGFTVGETVIAHGYGIGTEVDGGYAALAVVPADWVVRLSTLTPLEAATIGTAGFTAAMSVVALLERGLDPCAGPVLVTGATGGVGSISVDILAGLGFEVVASTGKAHAVSALRELGAAEVIGRLPENPDAPRRPLDKAIWASAVDCVGGATLADVLSAVKYGGAVAASGLTGGAELHTTVMPFILRGVALLGMDSVQLPIEARRKLWRRLETDLKPRHLSLIAKEIGIADLTATIAAVKRGTFSGRAVVRLGSDW